MHQPIKIIRKEDIENQQMQMLHLEADYLLSTLFQAMQQKNVKEIIQCKGRLKEISEEMVEVQQYI